MEAENLVRLKSHWVSEQRGTLSRRLPSLSSFSSLWRCSAPPFHRSQASQVRHPERRTKLLWKMWLCGRCQETIQLSLDCSLIAIGRRLHFSSQQSFTTLSISSDEWSRLFTSKILIRYTSESFCRKQSEHHWTRQISMGKSTWLYIRVTPSLESIFLLYV